MKTTLFFTIPPFIGFAPIATAFALMLHAALVFSSPVKEDEDLVFFPTAARQDGGEWIVPVHAWVFEPEHGSLPREFALASLAKAFGLDDKAVESAVFRERARWFLVDNERGKEVITDLSEQIFGPTEANGHAHGEIRLQRPGRASLSFRAVLPASDNRVFKGEAVLVPQEGLSVISDIDDTIKISEVTDRNKLLEHTFLKPFEAAPGMADAYTRLANAGAAFHYVSSSPWQLYPALGAFMEDAKYPQGSVHLRLFRVKDDVKDDTVFNLLKSSEVTKPPVINKLLTEYPKREFIFIGDSGEKDAEIYGKIARENPGRVKHIYIRRVTLETRHDRRYQTAFESLDPAAWTVFDDPSEIRP